MAEGTVKQDLAAAQVVMAARIAREWGQDAAARYIANEKRKSAWLIRHGFSEIKRSHVCWRWLTQGRCTLGWRCNSTVGHGYALEHAFSFMDRSGERVIVCAPYPDNFSTDVVSAVCAARGLRADIRKTDTYYNHGTIHVEFRVA